MNQEDFSIYWHPYRPVTCAVTGSKETHIEEQTVTMVSLCMVNRNPNTDCQGPVLCRHSPLPWMWALGPTLSWQALRFEAQQRQLFCVGSWCCFGFSFFHQICRERAFSVLWGAGAESRGKEAEGDRLVRSSMDSSSAGNAVGSQPSPGLRRTLITGFWSSVIDGFLRKDVVI